MQQHTGGFLDPEDILRQLPLRSSLKIADFGCGHGYFSLPLAKFIPDGEIYAIDVLEKALQAVRSKAEIENIQNIKTIRNNIEKPEGSGVERDSMDMVILANILFQSQKKEEILKEADRVLKKGGSLVVVDWVAGSTMAPKEGWLISKEALLEMVEAKSFKFIKDLKVDHQHYGLVFKKI